MVVNLPFRLVVLAALASAAVAGIAQQASPPAKPARQFELLHASDFAPDVVLPPPPARGSDQEKAELAELHLLIDTASPARRDQAKADASHEDPGIYDAAVGAKLEAMPATWALLRLVQHEADTAADLSKLRFARYRPFVVDRTLPNCDGTTVPTRSYPSGHATLGYSVALTLSSLMPAKAPAIMARARDYAMSREICGVHFPSDTDASHAIGSIVATRILLDPAATSRIAAARAELARLP